MKSVVRIASGQGFWGDQLDAPKQQIEGGPIDYLMLDYLAEVTMSIMQKQRGRDPSVGYARDFVPLMAETLPRIVERGIKVIANAGGVNPEGCAEAVLRVAREAGLGGKVKVGVVTGDDILPRIDDLLSRGIELRNMESGESIRAIRDHVQSANVYIGARPIADALAAGADVVITGRATDTALTYGPLMHEFGWGWEEFDRIAAGIVAGHINECGAQSSGGNTLIDWATVPNLGRIGYPIVEVRSDGTLVVTKHPGTGGRITVPTVKEQLVYELGDPKLYVTPDGTADFTTLSLRDLGGDRVEIGGARGGPPPEMLKASIAYGNGYKAVGTLVYGWPEAIAKAQSADRILRERLDRLGLTFDEIHTEFVGWNATHGPLAGDPPPDIPEVTARWAVRGHDVMSIERFGKEIAPLVLSGPPTVTGYLGGRPKAQEIIAYWPALIPREEVEPFLRVEVHTA